MSRLFSMLSQGKAITHGLLRECTVTSSPDFGNNGRCVLNRHRSSKKTFGPCIVAIAQFVLYDRAGNFACLGGDFNPFKPACRQRVPLQPDTCGFHKMVIAEPVPLQQNGCHIADREIARSTDLCASVSKGNPTMSSKRLPLGMEDIMSVFSR
jgi:hypothetical protein